MMQKISTLLLSVLLLSACTNLQAFAPFQAEEPSILSRVENAEHVAAQVEYTKRIVETDMFEITTFGTLKAPAKPVHIYIEGDGYTHHGKRASLNTTPVNPIALELATADGYENVIYIARPCQFTDNDPKCSASFWTSHRYATEVLNSIHQVLNHIKAQYGMKSFHLTGYNGGGAIASILAAKRDDILSLRTVAANLDYVAYATLHEGDVMRFSLNAADFAPGLENIPQIHFTGVDDTDMPASIFESFKAHMDKTECVRHETIQNTGHEAGWAKRWPALLVMKPFCKK